MCLEGRSAHKNEQKAGKCNLKKKQDTDYVVFATVFWKNTSLGSSVSVASDYRLDDRSSIPARGKGLFL
jgi:hypothetical protein